MMLAVIAAAAILAGAVALYLASPQQNLVTRRMPVRALGWVGMILLIVGQLLLLTWAGPATAVFIALTLAMLAWTIVPLFAGWRTARRSSRP